MVFYTYMHTPLAWTAFEYEHRERSSDWFWSVGIVTVGAAVLAIVFGNLLFAVVIIVGALALSLHVLRHPSEIRYEIGDKGIAAGAVLYPYSTLESFWIHEHSTPDKLILTSKKMVMPHISIPLSGVTAEQVRDALIERLPEEEVLPSLSERIMETLGF